MPYGGGSLYLRGQTWWVQYWHRGQRCRESTGTRDRQQAFAFLTDRLARVGREPAGRTRDVTVGDLLDLVLAEHELRRSAWLPSIRVRVAQVRDALGWVPAAELTALQVERATRAWLRLPGRTPGTMIAVATVNNWLRTIARALALGHDRRLIASIPVRVRALPGAQVREGWVEYATMAQVMPHVRVPAVVDLLWWLYYTGMRIGEATQLRWDWYSPETRTLSIPGRATKGRRQKGLACTGVFGEVLAARLVDRRPDCPLVFHRDGHRIPLTSLQKWWREALAAAGIPRIMLHDLRRSGVRNLIRAGVDRETCKTISGHRTDAIFGRYNIVADDDLVAAPEQLARYLARTREPGMGGGAAPSQHRAPVGDDDRDDEGEDVRSPPTVAHLRGVSTPRR